MKLKKKVKKFPNGGKAPIKGTKEQYQAYQDSLDLYNKNFKSVKDIERKLPTYTRIKDEELKDFPDKIKPAISYEFNPTKVNDNEDYSYIPYYKKGKLIPGVALAASIYQEPVQPIIYQPEAINPIQGGHLFPGTGTAWNGTFQQIQNQSQRINPLDLLRPKEQPINIQSAKPDLLQGNSQQLEFNPIGFQKGSYFTRDAQQQEVGGKEYFDKVTGHKLMANGGGINTLPIDNTRVDKIYIDKSKSKKTYQSPFSKDKQEWINKSTGRIEESMSPLDLIPIGAVNTSSKFINNAFKFYSNYNKAADVVNGYELYNDLDKLPGKKENMNIYRDGGFDSLPQVFADGGISRFEVPVQQAQGLSPFQLPYNEIATALLSKQKSYDEKEAEMAKNQAFLADLKSGYRTAGLPQEIQKEYNDKFQSYVGQDLTKPEIKRAFVGDVARLKSDPRLRTLAADIKQSALWDNYQQAHPDLAGAAVNPYNVNGQWTPAKDAQGNWQDEGQVNNWYGNITPYSDFNKMIDDSYGKVKENTISKIKESNPSAEFHTDADGKSYYTTTTTGFKKNYIDATLPQWKDAAKETAFNIKNSNLPEAKYFRGTFQNEINQNPNFVEDYVSTAGGKFMYNRTETSEKNDIRAGGSGSGDGSSDKINKAQPREVTQILQQNTAIPKGELPTQVIKNYQTQLKTTFDNYEKQGFATDVDADGFKFLAPKPGETIAETSTRESNNNALKLLQQKQANALDIHKALAEKHGFDSSIDLEKQVKNDKVKQEILQIQAQAQVAKNTSAETRRIMEADGEPEEKIKAQIDNYNAQVDKSTTYRMQQAIKKDPAFKSYLDDLEALQEGIQESGTLAYPITGEKYQATRDNVKALLLDKTNYKVGDQGSIEYLQSNKNISDDDKEYINKYITEKGKDAVEGVSSLLWDREKGEYAVLVDIPRTDGDNIHLKISQRKLPTLPTISKDLDNLYNDFDRQTVRDNYQSYETKTDENHGILMHPDLSKAIVTTHVPTEEKLPGGKVITQGQTVFTLPELPNVLLRMNSFDKMYDFLTYYNNPQNAGVIKDPQQLLQAVRQYSLEDIAVPDNIFKRYNQKIREVQPTTSPK